MPVLRSVVERRDVAHRERVHLEKQGERVRHNIEFTSVEHFLIQYYYIERIIHFLTLYTERGGHR